MDMTRSYNDFTRECDKYILSDFAEACSCKTYILMDGSIDSEGSTSKLIPFRYPGATRGHLQVSSNNIIENIEFYDTAYERKTLTCYSPEISKIINDFIGKEFIVENE